MHSSEKQLLDLDQTYPCPSCKQGTLVPITLTEAWGCDRCKQIFELKPQPNTIGKLTTPYPRQRTWQWTGKNWVLSGNRLKSSLTEAYIWTRVALLPMLFWLVWTLLALTGLPAQVRIALILLTLVVMFWLVLRR
ncbi:MAG: hypothetical protein AAFP20_14375 [Cyanobacteria bacterium J06614_10]